MKSLQYEIAYSDGFFHAILRMKDLLSGDNVWRGFTSKQIQSALKGIFNHLEESEKSRDTLRSVDHRSQIRFDIDKENKKCSMKNFRIELN